MAAPAAAETSRFGLWSATYPEEWIYRDFRPGDIITTTLPMHVTDIEGLQAVFVVVGSFQDGDGGIVSQVRSIGSNNPEATQKLSSAFNRRSGYVHFCKALEECDYRDPVVFHCKVLTLSDPVGFSSGYVGATGKRLLKQVLSDVGLEAAEIERREEIPGEAEPGEEAAANATGEKRLGEERKKVRRERGKGGGDVRKPDAKANAGSSKHDELRRRLEALRQGTAPEPEVPAEKAGESSKVLLTPRLTAGRKLMDIGGGIDDFLLRAQESALREAEKQKKRGRVDPEDGGAKGNVGNQLALLAASRARQPSIARGGAPGEGGKKKKKKGKKRRKASGKKKKSHKKRSKHPGGSGGGSGGSPSSSGSSSSSSASRSSKSEESSSAESLLPPLRRRSKKEAGSVLELLIRQVEEQLSELQGTDPNSQSGLGGTKMVSYFHLMIKGGGLQVNSRDGRELFLLANLIDLLRMGHLALLGDGLASRFLAIQQAHLDSNWVAARFLEIYTPEVATAAGASMTLEARRHARLVEKARGVQSNRGRSDNSTWSRPSTWNSDPWDGYGDTPKGKGKKGKGKGKGGSGRGKAGSPWRGGSAWEGGNKGNADKDKSGEKEKDPK